MESMINAPQPTRAEVSDVANAIFDGADAVMTSEETSLGLYPVETITMMSTIAVQVEDTEQRLFDVNLDIKFPITHAIAHSVQESSERLNVPLIVALTETGRTAQSVSQFRGTKNILALTPVLMTARKLSIVRGVTPLVYEPHEQIAESRAEIKSIAQKYFKLKKNDTIIIASGGIMRQPGSTNMMIIEKI
jgi:pyruvate kinase